MKRTIALLLTALFLLASMLGACSTQQQKGTDEAADAAPTTAENTAQDSEIIEAFYANFIKLTEIPRPSHHEEKISAFLVDWAKDKGYEPVQDESLNVMFDVPATPGKEDMPLVALQVHMDMVAVADDGLDFDPLNDPIKPIRDDEAGTVTADGTSLGADDGAGVAAVMTFLEQDEEHGPLRIIITTNEENGMTGTFNMDHSWVKEPKYLINLDGEESSSIIVSTAAGDLLTGSKEVTSAEPKGNTALSVRISGLTGGHSGVEIDKGRCNGIIALGTFLKKLSQQGIAFEIASFEGGTAPNAIPKSASCVIAVDEDSKALVVSAAEDHLEELKAKYKGIEDAVEFTVSDAEMPSGVVSAEDADSVITLTTGIIDGVYTMSPDKEGLVESSSNLGVFALSTEGSTFTSYVRSSVEDKQTEIVDAETALAESCGYSVQKEKSADPWPYRTDNRLMDIAAKVYQEQNGSDVDLIALHAGLECGSYALYNPDLMMISIGPDIIDVHSPAETLMLSSVPKVYNLLKGILLRVDE